VTRPTPDELAATPELGLLAALEASLDLSLLALVAAHPELCDPERPPWRIDPGPACRAAKDFVPLARKLGDAIADYRRAVATEHQRPIEDDFPF